MAYNVLIVDDSQTTRGMIRRVLGLTGLPLGEIWEAENGLTGLEAMRANWVDVVLADLNMPDMTGQEMIGKMAEDPLLAKLPVIVVSSEGNQSILDSLTSLGVKEILRKPFSPAFLKDTLVRVLGSAVS